MSFDAGSRCYSLLPAFPKEGLPAVDDALTRCSNIVFMSPSVDSTCVTLLSIVTLEVIVALSRVGEARGALAGVLKPAVPNVDTEDSSVMGTNGTGAGEVRGMKTLEASCWGSEVSK